MTYETDAGQTGCTPRECRGLQPVVTGAGSVILVDDTMNRCTFTLILTALTLSVAGCKSPIQKLLAKCPGWKQEAQYIASQKGSNGSGLAKEPFPNLDNPTHMEIWKALWKNGKVGDGFGSICSYYGFYLVTVSDLGGYARSSSFYDPTNRFVVDGSPYMDICLYGGDKTATTTNVVVFVQHLLAVSGDKAFIVNDASDIPHSSYLKDNPALSFSDLLSSKGIAIRPPSIMRKNEDAQRSDYSEYTVFVYTPCGGQLFRYEVRCRRGQIDGVERFLIGAEIGDFWLRI